MLPAVLIFLAAIVFAGAIAWSLKGSFGLPASSQTNQNNVIAEDVSHFSASLPYSIGAITAIGSNSFTISLSEGSNPSGAHQGTSGDETLTIVVTDTTEIFTRGAQKDPQIYAAEVEEFRQKTAHLTDTSVIYLAPDLYEYVPLPLSELQTGMIAHVTPASMEGSVITAKRAVVLPI